MLVSLAIGVHDQLVDTKSFFERFRQKRRQFAKTKNCLSQKKHSRHTFLTRQVGKLQQIHLVTLQVVE